jgi:hypothetical protein
MKPASALLVLSLAANVIFAWHIFAPPARPQAAAVAPRIAGAAGQTESPSPVLPAPSTAEPGAGVAASSASLEAMRDRLRALGFPKATVRDALRALIEAPRHAREREFRLASATSPQWWRISSYIDPFTPDQRKDLAALRLVEHDELSRLFGAAGLVDESAVDRFALLPPEKAERMAVIESDYDDLRRENGSGSYNPLSSPGAVERDRAIKAEYERDVAALLTPDERAMLAMRDSSTATRLNDKLNYFDATEAEYRAIYAAQKAFDEKFPSNSGMDFSPARREAETQLNQSIAVALGADRYATWTSSQRMENRALIELQHRADLPQPTVDAIAAMPRQMSAATERIVADGTLTPEQKTAAIKDLAVQAREQVRTTLGAAYGDAYLNATGTGGWISILERGSAFTYNQDGVPFIHGVTSRPPPAPPGK